MPFANAGADQNVSDPPGSAQLSGSAPIHPGTCIWTIVAGTGTFSNANDPNATVSFLGMGTNVIQWTCDNGPCGVTADIVELVVTAAIGIDEAAMDELDMYFDHAGQRLVFGPRSQGVTLALTDLQGRIIREGSASVGTGPWDLTDLPAGPYLISGMRSGQYYAFRFLKY
ncbi:MAG: hypothetical protein R2818_10080 [Flavobacteriales bacterium]